MDTTEDSSSEEQVPLVTFTATPDRIELTVVNPTTEFRRQLAKVVMTAYEAGPAPRPGQGPWRAADGKYADLVKAAEEKYGDDIRAGVPLPRWNDMKEELGIGSQGMAGRVREHLKSLQP